MNAGLSQFGMDPRAIGASIFYAFLGLLLMVVFIALIDKVLKLNFRKELLEDQNTALAILIAGISIGISVIIAAAIH